MMNIVFYGQNGGSEYCNLVSNTNDEFMVRELDFSEVKNYKSVNPAVVVMDAPIDEIRNVCAVTKFETSLLIIVDEIPEDLTVRADVFDFIERPVNPKELNVRVEALAKGAKYRINLKRQSVTDELTGLYNRKYLHHRLEAEMSRAKRYGTQLSCLSIDIDFFKTVNDMYGYDWGDVLLKKIAQMLEALVRKEDILTRYGDEEFILILPNTSEDNAYIFAERFRRDIEKMEFIPANEEERHPITISGGISSYPFLENVDENVNTIIRYAEHALYAAKKHGKNQIVEFSKMNLDY